MLVRYRTTGMTEQSFKIDGTFFKICDVGGQRNERRKWIHFFDSVTAVIFVSSLSAYDETIFEDENANAMDESLTVFDETVNMNWFVCFLVLFVCLYLRLLVFVWCFVYDF